MNPIWHIAVGIELFSVCMMANTMQLYAGTALLLMYTMQPHHVQTVSITTCCLGYKHTCPAEVLPFDGVGVAALFAPAAGAAG